MEYMLICLETEAKFAERRDPAKADAYRGAWMAYVGAAYQAGIVRASGGLEPPETATSVRLRDGKRQVQDGPFGDSKEQLGGFFVIDVPNLDAALEWAARCPAAAYATVEVRPLMVAPAGACATA